MNESEPFYMPDPDLFGHNDAYPMFTGYAARLVEAGLASRFPEDAELRNVTIELLAHREAVEMLLAMPELIDEAIEEARGILEERRS